VSIDKEDTLKFLCRVFERFITSGVGCFVWDLSTQVSNLSLSPCSELES